jgi:membrane protease YdiL (CAAX protease family)
MPVDRKQILVRILLFALLVNGFAWLGPLLGGSPAEPGPGFLLWGIAPILAALIMRYGLRDKVDMGWRLHLRGNVGLYLLSLLVHPLIIAGVTAIGLATGLIAFADGFTVAAFVGAMAPLAVIYFVFSIFEEVGWRGYLTPSVFRINDRLPGYAIIGVIWASWHFPYLRELWAHTDEGLLTLLPRFVLGAIVFSVLYGEIRMRTRSVWPAVLMHWSGNTVANTLLSGFAGAGFVILAPDAVWLSSYGLEGALVMAVVALVGGAFYWRRVADGVANRPVQVAEEEAAGA